MIDAANMEYYNKPLPAMSIGARIGQTKKQHKLLFCRYADIWLSFFSEIGEAERCGALVFLAFMKADDDQHDDCHDVGEHLEDFLRASRKSADVEIHPVQNAEKIRAPHGVFGFPGGEDDQRNGEPAESFDRAVVCPGAFDVVHDVVKPTETGDARADAVAKYL